MQTVEQLQAKQAAELAALQREHAIANALPLAPSSIVEVKGLPPKATYKVQGVRGALELLQKFPVIVPFTQYRNGWLRLTPLELVPEHHQTSNTDGAYAAHLNTNYHAESHCNAGTDAKLKFFTRAEGVGIVQISADITGPDYIGGYHRLNPTTNQKGARGRIVERTFSANPMLNGYFDRVQYWSTGDIGPIKAWANVDYLLCADTDADSAPEKQSHAIGQLVNLADELEPLQ